MRGNNISPPQAGTAQAYAGNRALGLSSLHLRLDLQCQRVPADFRGRCHNLIAKEPQVLYRIYAFTNGTLQPLAVWPSPLPMPTYPERPER